jgi:hypothetical protein
VCRQSPPGREITWRSRAHACLSECLCTFTPITIIRLASNQKKGRPASGQTSIEAKATLLSGHARRSREGGGDTTLASRQKADIRESSQPPPTRTLKLEPDGTVLR